MAKLRKFVTYRRLERPYTRKSKFRNKSFVRANPHNKVIRYVMGNQKKEFLYIVKLVSETDLQIRHNAIEAARQSCNKYLEVNAGREEYKFHIRLYAHHILRENRLASGAGADRTSSGMKHSFGKSLSRAAQVKKGKVVAEVRTSSNNIVFAKTALKRFSHKLPNSWKIEVRAI
ncbi:50S ribosomal protein L16 [Candidatus Woesearchaeota archaeon]|jgi:large subunit ribosomal protein L10e|nr:50S ribosomal protein L16 [Candidatus Woesearchaeota archaeon]MBT4387789.1 50S ribosomal protein L16 [Candidatus Woesearchaeota archaeon]MBT4595608.1 50S ribosomal protein L16 [Candidatus Woesearchaeota archaeon]MBT5740909.1 50S ribosomal protein L16 [Candidatus Woesearchaeota archaeon]MBT6505874.1 50S ribosomal protein L16 [Candidatus Woesearchaeota archaeon]